ncbi:MAG: hypothetical protein ACI837_000753 [Crocinitomicaceae bacterium]|jgi:hypothetical protein
MTLFVADFSIICIITRMIDYSVQIKRIQEKLINARSVDEKFVVFGAEGHQYLLNDPVDVKDVEAFESKFSIQLPECYRSFILNVGNGGIGFAGSGAGPFYGIYALGKNVDELIDVNPEFYLKEECNLNPNSIDEQWAHFEKTIWGGDISDEAYDDALGKMFGGILPIGSQGGTTIHGLVLNGSSKGKVLNINIDQEKPKFTFEDNFLDWYERWLVEVISGDLMHTSTAWFGYTMAGSVEELLEIFESSDDLKIQKDTLNAILKKGNVSEESLRIIKHEYLNGQESFKNQLLGIMAKCNYQLAKPYLIEAGEVDFTRVLGLISIYARDKGREWIDFIEQNIPEIQDTKTFFACTRILEESNIDYGEMIVPFTVKGDERLAMAAYYSIGLLKNKEKYLDAFIHGLNHGSTKVVHSALQALSDLKDRKLLKEYRRLAQKFPVEQDYILSNLGHRLSEYGLNLESIKSIDLDNFEIY